MKPLGSACNTVVRNGTNECPLLSTCDGFGPVCKGTQYCGEPRLCAATTVLSSPLPTPLLQCEGCHLALPYLRRGCSADAQRRLPRAPRPFDRLPAWLDGFDESGRVNLL